MPNTPTPFPPRPANPNAGPLLGSNIQCLETLRAAARRWYELRPQYAKRLLRPDLCAAWDAFETAVLDLDPDARFDFGDAAGKKEGG